MGERIPIPWTASGRLLLAHMSDDEIVNFVPDKYFILPDVSRLNTEKFIASVRHAHSNEFFSFDSLADTYTHCFAAPIYGDSGICHNTLCIIAPKEDARANFDQYRDVLVQTAGDLTAKLRSDKLESVFAVE